MTIYNISIITSSGFPYYYKEIKKLPYRIKLYQRFYDFTEFNDRKPPTIDPISHFELNAGLISALFEFAKNLDKKIRTLEFKTSDNENIEENSSEDKNKGDVLICAQTETYLSHKFVKEKIKLIYNLIVIPKMPLESAYIIDEAEEKKIIDILSDQEAKKRILLKESEIKKQAELFLEEMGPYGLNNIVITSFDLSPILILGEKYSSEDINTILRKMGGIPRIDPLEWKFLQSFYKEKQIWVYIINSGVGVTVEKKLFEPYYYLLFTESESYLAEFPGKLTTKFNFILG